MCGLCVKYIYVYIQREIEKDISSYLIFCKEWKTETEIKIERGSVRQPFSSLPTISSLSFSPSLAHILFLSLSLFLSFSLSLHMMGIRFSCVSHRLRRLGQSEREMRHGEQLTVKAGAHKGWRSEKEIDRGRERERETEGNRERRALLL